MFTTRLFGLLIACLALFPLPARAVDKVSVAYFLEWPTANQVAQIDRTYDEVLGVPVEWRAFSNGTEMTQAMIAGEVDIAYAQGFVPFVVGVSEGAPIKVVGVAVTYSDNDACIVRDDAGITRDNAAELEGRKVATTLGNVTHYKLLRSLDVLGVDASKVELVEMNPAAAAVALVRGDVPMACAFGGALERMKTVGRPLLTGAEQEAAGISTYDVVSVTDAFAAENPELVRLFMAVTAQADAAYKADPEKAYARLSRASGMALQDMKSTLAGFRFPDIAEQRSDKYLGGGLVADAKGIAKIMQEAGNIERVLDDYSSFITDEFLPSGR